MLFAFFEASFIKSLGNAIAFGSALGIIFYSIFVLMGLWLGIGGLKDFLRLDLAERSLECLIQNEKKKP
jgi:hypothetical protein